MAKSQPYYYSDAMFQLELNIQHIRRALIRLLEESEATECFTCDHLKCRCEDASSKSSTLSDLGMGRSEPSNSSVASELEYLSVTAPPAETLPMPVWEFMKNASSSPEVLEYFKGVEKWVRASTPHADPEIKVTKQLSVRDATNNNVNGSWPPSPKSIWRTAAEAKAVALQAKPLKPQVKTRVQIEAKVINPVQAFFRSFSDATLAHGYSYF